MSGLGALPAHASLPLTYDHMAGRPRHVAPESVALDNNGKVLVADTNSIANATDDRVVKYTSDGTFLDVIAGPGAAPGSLLNPTSVTVAPTGGHNIYVVENGGAVSGLTGATDRVSYFDPTGTYLGTWGNTGSGNGSFSDPQGIAVDSTGNVYVADTGNNRVQKFTSSGGWLASWDSTMGIDNPLEIAIDASDKVWVVDGASVSRYSGTGTLLTSWLSGGATGIDIDSDGNVWVTSTAGVVREYDVTGVLLATLGAGQLSGTPQGLAVASNAVYVADTGNGRVARFALPTGSTSWSVPSVTGLATDGSSLFTADGTDVNTYSLSGTPGTTWASNDAYSTTVDASGNVWVSSVADGVVREYDQTGALLATIGSGILSSPHGISVASATGKLFVADTGNNRIARFVIATGVMDANWTVNGVTGVAVNGSTVYSAAGNFVRPYTTSGSTQTAWASNGATDLTVDGSGNIWVSSSDGVVREYNSSKALLATVGAGTLSAPVGVAVAGGRLYVADTANDAVFRFSFASFDTSWGKYPGAGVEDVPSGIAVDASNNVYVTNKAEDKIQKFDASGAFLLAWGGHGSGNGQLIDPAAIAVAPSGLVYVTDTGNNRIEVFDQSGVYQMQWGSFGTNASLKQMDTPSGIAIDAAGNVYVADLNNHRIEKFGADGAYVNTWGLYGTGDGQFNEPRGIAVDPSGNVWVADSRNNRIQEFTSGGSFLTKWGGSGTGGVSSSSQDGKFSRPYDLDFDAEGSIWVADRNNHRIQRMTTGGIFLSKLGSLGLDIAQFNFPSGIVIDAAGLVSITDSSNNRVQVFIDANGPDTTFTGGPATVTSQTTATFTFTANEPGATFECTIDGGGSGPWSPCTSGVQFPALAEGSHTVYVRATDAGSNVGDPATYDWAVDLTAPTVSIDTSPSSPTKSTGANFTYHSSDANSTYMCSLDGSSPAGCGASYSGTVANGDHTFDVWAIDPAGNQSTNPAEVTWTVDTTPPNVVIDNGPTGYVRTTNASFDFHSADAGATFECHLDSIAYAACTSSADYSGLTAGLHTFYVRATDALGNISAAKTQVWTIDLQDHKPDGWIGVGGKYIGNNVYNSTAANQIKTVKTPAGKTITFAIRVENDGTDTDSYTMLGGGSAKGYTVSYFVGTTDYTNKVTNGTYTFSLASGAYKSLTMKVKVGATGKASWSSLVKVTSGHEPSKLDAVKGIVKRT